ncbi:RNA polymerase sigma factor [Brevibacillus humidisoli]|uniref:RNA polymerase sigma factor n=1 Tax=Brevibacillus humidisoli TaxID=2895522 RepID=UPI001E481868|nr:RNA polymerase sigma factor [Brevibacillus humidisoli]UFJ39726.1 RNA polymerase sigma factor [Brevibacillus humidisoli]
MLDKQLEAWVDLYAQRLIRLAYSYVSNRIDAEDLVQEAMIKGYRHRDQLNNESDPFPWLAKIVINECRMAKRKRWREVLMHSIPDGMTRSTEQKYVEKLTHEKIDDVVSSLPEKYRTPIILYYFEELTISEIAKIVGVKTGTIKSRLARGREAMKKRIGGDRSGLGFEQSKTTI